MLRLEQYLRLLPATSHATAPALISGYSFLSSPLPRLSALRLARSRPPPLRGKTSSPVRASAEPDSTVKRAPEMAQREVARVVADQAVARLGARLLPSAVPADVVEFRNAAGNAVGSLDVQRGSPGSSVQFNSDPNFFFLVVVPYHVSIIQLSCGCIPKDKGILLYCSVRNTVIGSPV